ncbi:MAG: tRNA 2-thiouridine(34) synthase MnmA [Acidimicrobiales bacterium]
MRSARQAEGRGEGAGGTAARRRFLVAMSGGVDSSVAAALLAEAGHEVVGVTMKLWGGESDTGCCSVSEVADARRVARQIGIEHLVFNFSQDFSSSVVEPYVAAHAAGRTPNPCIECNRHIKFDRLLARASRLGFDAVATGHYARVAAGPATAAGAGPGQERGWRLLRGVDPTKDQSYVVSMLRPEQLARLCFPVGGMRKAEVREIAHRFGLETATKPDSYDVCFITKATKRSGFLSERMAMHAGVLTDTSGAEIGAVPAVEMLTVGQRRGLGQPNAPGQGRRTGSERRYVVSVDVGSRTAVVGSGQDLLVSSVRLREPVQLRLSEPVQLRLSEPVQLDDGWGSGAPLEAQMSAHGKPVPARLEGDTVTFTHPVRRMAPGQTLVLYRGDEVVGSGTAGGPATPAARGSASAPAGWAP